MNWSEYIESGILELYVFGELSPEEAHEVSKKLKQHPEIRAEIEQIENAMMQLSVAAAPYNPQELLLSIKQKLQPPSHSLIRSKPQKNRHLITYISLAACILLAIGIVVFVNKNNSLQKEIQKIATENLQLENEIEAARENAQKNEELLNILRDHELTRVSLQGQKVAPEAFVTLIWDKENNRTFIDAQDLPKPPAGKVYQVWSLTLNPLTPTSIGLLSDFSNDKNKIFILPNANHSEAFGITLEPAGGSASPTMEQLYVLGIVSKS